MSLQQQLACPLFRPVYWSCGLIACTNQMARPCHQAVVTGAFGVACTVVPTLAESLGRDEILLFVELLAAGTLAAALPLTALLRLAAAPASEPRRGKMYGASRALDA